MLADAQPGDVVAYKLQEIGPARSPWISGWRFGVFAAVVGSECRVLPHPAVQAHPMEADWATYRADVLQGKQVQAVSGRLQVALPRSST